MAMRGTAIPTLAGPPACTEWAPSAHMSVGDRGPERAQNHTPPQPVSAPTTLSVYPRIPPQTTPDGT